MFDRSNSTKTGVLRSETYLSPNHTPEPPVGRATEIQAIADALRPLTHRRPPEHLIVHGPSGTGKTTCVRHVCNRIESETTTKTVSLNCWKYNTRASLLSALLIRLGYPVPRKGRPIDNLLSKLREWLDKHRGFAVVLDEFDQLKEKTQVIYDLQFVDQEAEHSVGIVMISNQDPSRIELGPRSRSRLHCTRLEFRPYTAAQLKQVLEKRVKHAFKPGSVPDKVLEVIAEHVAEDGGDCRKAVDYLLKAGRNANQAADRELNYNHLEGISGSQNSGDRLGE